VGTLLARGADLARPIAQQLIPRELSGAVRRRFNSRN